MVVGAGRMGKYIFHVLSKAFLFFLQMLQLQEPSSQRDPKIGNPTMALSVMLRQESVLYFALGEMIFGGKLYFGYNTEKCPTKHC